MKIIAVDTGNRMMKTPHVCFNSGLVDHGSRPPALNTDVLHFNGHYYTVTERRSTYLKDKSQNDTYFLLSLIAIGKELLLDNPNRPGRIEESVLLAVGLPPSHLPIYKESYSDYFTSQGQNIEFDYNEKHFCISIQKVMVFPQGYSAALDIIEEVKEYPMAYVVDIGGYTTDVLLLTEGKPDLSFCHSFNFGVIHMSNKVKREVSEHLDVDVEDIHIEKALRGNTTLQEDVRNIIQSGAKEYAVNLIRALKEKGVNTTVNMMIFVGGGSELFRDVLVKECPNTIFKTDVCSNARGYETLANISFKYRRV